MEKINVWFVVLPYEDNRPEIKWFLKEEDADEKAENFPTGEPIVGMVETFVGSNVYSKAQ